MNSMLDYKKTLMGFATIWLLFLHYYDQLYSEIHLPALTQIASIGYVGVEIFLFLSGAGLYYSLCNNPDIKDFYTKRIVRTVIPWLLISFPYWILKTVIADHESWGVFLMNLTGISFWTSNIHSVWYCAFIVLLYAVYPAVFKIQSKRYSIWPVMATVLAFNFYLFFLKSNYYRTIEIALTRIPVFLIGSYYAEQMKKRKSLTFFYRYGALGTIFYILSFAIQLALDLETLCRRYFAGGFAVAVMLVIVYFWKKKSNKHEILDFFGGISLEIYLISVLLRNIITRLEIGSNSGIFGKWLIVLTACTAIIILSKIFSIFYTKVVNFMQVALKPSK